jgi:hypothetical protein
MSMEINVVFRGPLPSKAALSRAMQELGFPLTITDTSGPLDEQNGFMPMSLQGEETGVEFDVFDGREDIEGIANGRDVDASFDRSGNFRWGGDESEMVCALCAAAALARLTNGVVFDEYEDDARTADQAIEEARRALESVLKQ